MKLRSNLIEVGLNSRQKNTIFFLRIFVDMLLLALAWCLAYVVRFHTFLPVTKGVPQFMLYFKLIPFIWMIWGGAFSLSGFYPRTGKHRTAFLEALDLLQSCFLAILMFISFTYFYAEYRYSRITLAFFVIFHFLFILAGRSFFRKVLRWRRRKTPPRRTLIIGSGPPLETAYNLLSSYGLTPSQVAGAVLVGQSNDLEASRGFCKEKGIGLYPSPASKGEQKGGWAHFFAENPIQTVFIALPHNSYPFLEEHLDQITDQVPDVQMIPDIVRFTRFSPGIDMVQGTPIISLHESPLFGIGAVFKRVLDVMGATVAIIIFGPLMGFIALCIPFSSKGPIIFRQKRMGLDGQVFHIYKFRTMPVDAEQNTGAVWASKGDNRATWLGKFLRRSSFDELPQLFNVLKGEMSLVGPRPERPVFVNEFRQKIPGYMLRHKVKAGMTGLAQIKGWRGDTSLEKRIECDLQYIQNWSLWFDIRILFLTVFNAFFNKNAY